MILGEVVLDLEMFSNAVPISHQCMKGSWEGRGERTLSCVVLYFEKVKFSFLKFNIFYSV